MVIAFITNPQNAALWNFFAMIAALLSAVAAAATAIIAFKASKTWKLQEKRNQMVRLKRAAFDYRSSVEHAGKILKDQIRLDDYIESNLKPALDRVFHELVLAGLDSNSLEQGKLYDLLFQNHGLFKERAATWRHLLNTAIDFQTAIEID